MTPRLSALSPRSTGRQVSRIHPTSATPRAPARRHGPVCRRRKQRTGSGTGTRACLCFGTDPGSRQVRGPAQAVGGHVGGRPRALTYVRVAASARCRPAPLWSAHFRACAPGTAGRKEGLVCPGKERGPASGGGGCATWGRRTSGCPPSAGRADLHPIYHQDRVDYAPSCSPPSPDVGPDAQLPRSRASDVLSPSAPLPAAPRPLWARGSEDLKLVQFGAPF